MAWNLPDLNAVTRAAMLRELEADTSAQKLVAPPQLNMAGEDRWPELLEVALARQDAAWLSESLRASKLLRDFDRQKNITVRLSLSAPDDMAEQAFLLYFARGLCVRALEESQAQVEVFAAKAEGRLGHAEKLVGRKLDPKELLEKLRQSASLEEALGFERPCTGQGLRLAGG